MLDINILYKLPLDNILPCGTIKARKRIKMEKFEKVESVEGVVPDGKCAVKEYYDENGQLQRKMNVKNIMKVVDETLFLYDAQRCADYDSILLHDETINYGILKNQKESTKDEKELNKLISKINVSRKLQRNYKRRIKRNNDFIDETFAMSTDDDLINMEFAYMAIQSLVSEQAEIMYKDKRRSIDGLVALQLETARMNLTYQRLHDRIVEYKPELFPHLYRYSYAVKRENNPYQELMDEYDIKPGMGITLDLDNEE